MDITEEKGYNIFCIFQTSSFFVPDVPFFISGGEGSPGAARKNISGL